MSIVLEALEKRQREEKQIVLSAEAQRQDISKGKILPKKSNTKKRLSIYLSIISALMCIGLLVLVRYGKTKKTKENKQSGWNYNIKMPVFDIDIRTQPSNSDILSSVDVNLPALAVTGIVWDEKDPIALINGKFLRVGDNFQGITISKISADSVTFLYKEKEFTIEIQ